MRKDEWDKLKRYLAPGGRSACPICNQSITEGCEGEGVTYSKTKTGTHLFIHEKCLGLKGGER